MENSINDYLSLVTKYPKLFHNPHDDGIIKIIVDPNEIASWQKEKELELTKNGSPLDWCKIGVLLDDPWFWVIRDLVEFPDGNRNGYIRFINRKSLDGESNVVVVPMLDNKFILIKHFRHEIRNWSWEFPRGFAEPGLTPEENARKELSEELGVGYKQIKEIGKIRELDGETVYFSAELANGTLNLELGEAITSFETVDLAELENWISTGRVNDPFSLNAYLFYLGSRKQFDGA